MSDNRAIVYPENDVHIYRASSVGKPLRCLAAARQQYEALPAPAYLVAAADAGNRFEPIVKARMVEAGWQVSGEQDELNIPAAPGTIVRGHMDAFTATPPPGTEYPQVTAPLEVKSMSKNVWPKWHRDRFESFPTYAAQIVSYMKGAGSDKAWYAVVNRDTEEIDVILVTLDTPHLPTWSSIVEKIALCEWFAKSNTLPACDTGTEYACPYEYLCDRREIYFAEVEGGDDATLERLAQQYDEIRQLEKDIAARKSDVRDEIMEALGMAKKRQIPGWSFSVSTRTTKRLSTERLRKRLGEELDEYFHESESAPFPTVRRTTKEGST